jgi:hypothetical protein
MDSPRTRRKPAEVHAHGAAPIPRGRCPPATAFRSPNCRRHRRTLRRVLPLPSPHGDAADTQARGSNAAAKPSQHAQGQLDSFSRPGRCPTAHRRPPPMPTVEAAAEWDVMGLLDRWAVPE